MPGAGWSVEALRLSDGTMLCVLLCVLHTCSVPGATPSVTSFSAQDPEWTGSKDLSCEWMNVTFCISQRNKAPDGLETSSINLKATQSLRYMNSLLKWESHPGLLQSREVPAPSVHQLLLPPPVSLAAPCVATVLSSLETQVVCCFLFGVFQEPYLTPASAGLSAPLLMSWSLCGQSA